MVRADNRHTDVQLATLARSDWTEILALAEKKTYQRKFQIIEAFIDLVAEQGLMKVTHAKIAKHCSITRQLVDHHFSNPDALHALAYRYMYALFQKRAADGILAKAGPLAQLDGYLDAILSWLQEHRSHARFLAQFFALLQVNPGFLELHERNLRIGSDRIVALCKSAQSHGLLRSTSEIQLRYRALSMQAQIAGFVILYSAKPKSSLDKKAKDELSRSCRLILGFTENSNATPAP